MTGSMKKYVLLASLAVSAVAFPANAAKQTLVDLSCLNPTFGEELFSVRGVYIKQDGKVLEITNPSPPVSRMIYSIPDGIGCIIGPHQVTIEGDNNNNDGS